MNLRHVCKCAFCAGNDGSNRAGIAVMDHSKKIHIIHRKYPYTSTTLNRKNDHSLCPLFDDNWRCKKNNKQSSPHHYDYTEFNKKNRRKFFWEEFALPRGKIYKARENSLLCALREFYEETGYVPFGKAVLCDTFFNLQWTDTEKTWKYTIYVMYVEKILKIPLSKNSSITQIHDSSTNEMRIDFNFVCGQLQKNIAYERRAFNYISVSFVQYLNYMNNVLAKNFTVVENNYLDFFNFVENFLKNIYSDRYISIYIGFKMYT